MPLSADVCFRASDCREFLYVSTIDCRGCDGWLQALPVSKYAMTCVWVRKISVACIWCVIGVFLLPGTGILAYSCEISPQQGQLLLTLVSLAFSKTSSWYSLGLKPITASLLASRGAVVRLSRAGPGISKKAKLWKAQVCWYSREPLFRL